MDLQLITLRLDPDTGEFPARPLANVEGEVIDVVEHFFHHGGLPHLLLVVHLRPPLDPTRRASTAHPPREREGGHVRATLDAAEQALYDKLAAWRNAAAQSAGTPPYVIANNREMAEVARIRPTSLTALRKISGFGDAKIRKFGEAIVALVKAEATGPSSQISSAASPPSASSPDSSPEPADGA